MGVATSARPDALIEVLIWMNFFCLIIFLVARARGNRVNILHPFLRYGLGFWLAPLTIAAVYILGQAGYSVIAFFISWFTVFIYAYWFYGHWRGRWR